MSDVRFIIVKYAEDYYPSGFAPEVASVGGTYSAAQCGINTEVYTDKVEAERDLLRLRDFNPTVGYGIVRVKEIANEET